MLGSQTRVLRCPAMEAPALLEQLVYQTRCFTTENAKCTLMATVYQKPFYGTIMTSAPCTDGPRHHMLGIRTCPNVTSYKVGRMYRVAGRKESHA